MRPRRYGLLLLILIASYLLSAFLGSRKHVGDVQVVLVTLAGLLALRTSPLRGRPAALLISAGLIGSLLAIILGLHSASDGGKGAAYLWLTLLLLAMVTVLIRHVIRLPDVTAQSLYGAISGYLLIGLLFAAAYSSMYYFAGGHFFAGGQPANLSVFQYFSFATLTTVGYGDYTAATSAGRAIAMIEAMSGQIFLATLVAKLVASYRRVS